VTLLEAAQEAAESHGCVLVREYAGQRLRHLALRWDGARPFVRVGRGGAVKRYLSGFALLCPVTRVFAFTVESVTHV
jgi:predicted NBD/HSP70 family sugar kinase